MVPSDFSYEDSCRLFCRGIHQIFRHHEARHIDFYYENLHYCTSVLLCREYEPLLPLINLTEAHASTGKKETSEKLPRKGRRRRLELLEVVHCSPFSYHVCTHT